MIILQKRLRNHALLRVTFASELGVPELMPLGELRAVEFVRLLAKIAHGYAVAERGLDVTVHTPPLAWRFEAGGWRREIRI
jgi:hypothetical protein